jgi:NADH:ubiquinone oxidoreductase subunit 4 (subunit M)
MLYLLLIFPLLGVIFIITNLFNEKNDKYIGLYISIINLILSLIIFILFDFSNIDYQFVQEIKEFKGLNIYIGIDSISIYFILLTTLIMPLVILSN